MLATSNGTETSSHALFHPSVDLAQLRAASENRALRNSLQENRVTFPAQVPVFKKQSRPDLQWKLAVLYFVRGWTMESIAERYGLGRQRVGQIITAWRTRAVNEGYVQQIELETLPDSAPLDQLDAAGQATVSISSPDPSRFGNLQGHQTHIDRAVDDSSPIHVERVDAPGDSSFAAAASSGAGSARLIEELHAIVCVLDNQLTVCSKPRFRGTRHSCHQLLARAKELCDRLELQLTTTRSRTLLIECGYDEWRAESVLAAARGLLGRFPDNTFVSSPRAPEAVVNQAGKNNAAKPPVSMTNGHRSSGEAHSVALQHARFEAQEAEELFKCSK